MRILREALDAVAEQALRHHPAECCGVLLAGGGDRSIVTRAMAADNAEEDRPQDVYVLGHRAHLRAVEMEAAGSARIVGYYHSHPNGSAEPSRRDRDEAVPGAVYLIASVRENRVEHAAWRLADDEFVSVPVEPLG